MGIDDTAPFSNVLDQSADEELDRLGRWAERRDMRLLPKTHRSTWSASAKATAGSSSSTSSSCHPS